MPFETVGELTTRPTLIRNSKIFDESQICLGDSSLLAVKIFCIREIMNQPEYNFCSIWQIIFMPPFLLCNDDSVLGNLCLTFVLLMSGVCSSYSFYCKLSFYCFTLALLVNLFSNNFLCAVLLYSFWPLAYFFQPLCFHND